MKVQPIRRLVISVLLALGGITTVTGFSHDVASARCISGVANGVTLTNYGRETAASGACNNNGYYTGSIYRIASSGCFQATYKGIPNGPINSVCTTSSTSIATVTTYDSDTNGTMDIAWFYGGSPLASAGGYQNTGF